MPNPYLRVMCQGWSVISGMGVRPDFEVSDRVAIDTHVGVIGIGQKTDDSGFFRDESVTQFVFVIFCVDLPGPPNEIDSICDFGHESFGEAESPVAIFVVGGSADGVTAGVGGIIPGAVVVGGPVDELEVSVGADGVYVEEIGQGELAEAEFEAAARKFFEEGEKAALVFDFIFAQGKDFVNHGAAQVRRFAQERVADDIEIGIAGEAEAQAECGSASFFEIDQKFGGIVQANAGVKR